jgi:hypothetical protein
MVLCVNGKNSGTTPQAKFLQNLRNTILSNKDVFANMYSFADKYIEKATSFFKSLKT